MTALRPSSLPGCARGCALVFLLQSCSAYPGPTVASQDAGGGQSTTTSVDEPLGVLEEGGVEALGIGDALGISPSELVAMSGKGKVLLSWTKPAGVPRTFSIYRGTRAGEQDALPIADGLTESTYVDAAVANGTRYYYRVAETAHLAPRSNEVTARPTDGDATVAFQALIARKNAFVERTYLPHPLAPFSADRLPQPVVDDHPEWVALYTKAWELAFRGLKQPTPANGFVSNYIDPAFNRHIFQWDTIFMLQFARYARPYVDAIGSLDNFYAKQHPDGFICREIDEANGADFLFNSITDAANPPLYSWAEWRYFQVTGDARRFDDALVPIAKHYDWLKKNRTRTSGAYWNTGLGAGEDDLHRGAVDAWVDMTAQQAQNALYSGLMATLIERDAEAAYFLDEYLALSQLLRAQFWDGATQMFSDLQRDGSPTGVKTVLGFWPLLAHVATASQADSLLTHLQNPAEFWRPNVIPVLAMDEPGYTPQGNYWNGAVWAPTNYMAVRGLEDYGMQDVGREVSRRYLANMAKSFADTGTIWEHYAPESATGEGVRDFVGWSGLGPIALLIESILGIHVDAPSNAVQWRPRLPARNGIANLAVGDATLTLFASALQRDTRTLTFTTTKPITVAVDTGTYKATYVLAPGTRRVTVPASQF